MPLVGAALTLNKGRPAKVVGALGALGSLEFAQAAVTKGAEFTLGASYKNGVAALEAESEKRVGGLQLGPFHVGGRIEQPSPEDKIAFAKAYKLRELGWGDAAGTLLAALTRRTG